MRLRDGVSVGFVLGASATSVFAIGGADRWAQALVALLVAGALIPQVGSRRVLDRISPLTALIGLAIALTAFQLIPLPVTLVQFLNPIGATLREDGAQLIDVSPWQAMTLDAPGTLQALAFFLVLLGVAVLALRLSVSERGRYRVIASITLLCSAAAVVIGIHVLLGAHNLYGIYELKEAHPSVLGPLLNENHLGCLMAVGTVLGVGLVLYRRQRSWVRAGWLFAVAACGASTVASQSRGATLALIVGSLVVAALRLAQRLTRNAKRHKARFTTSSLPLAVIAACAIVVVVYASAGGVSDRLSRTTLGEIDRPTTKFMAWRSAIQLIDESPWIGVGRGAFESAFTRVNDASSIHTYSHLENEYVQAVVDWGIPGACLLGLATLWLLATALRRWHDGPLAAGALGAITVVLIQSNVDFGIELLGLAVPITAVAATLAYVPLKESESRRLVVGRVLRGTHVIALVVAAWLLMSTATTTIAEDHAHLLQLRAPSIEDVRPVLDRHPLDYYGYAVASEALIRHGDPQAIRLLNHAMTLHPTYSGLHLIAGRLLRASGHREQAAIEYASAVRGAFDPRKIIAEIVSVFPPELAAIAIPADTHVIDEIIAALQELNRLDVTVLWLGHVLDLGTSLRACETLYRIAIATNDAIVAGLASRRCPEYEPSQEERTRLAQMLLGKHDYAETIHMLQDVERWEGRIDEKQSAWLALCDAHAALERWDEARHCLHRLEASGGITVVQRSEIGKRLDQIRTDETAADLRGGSAAPHQADRPRP